MAYNTYPAVDENYKFPPAVRQATADSTEIASKIDSVVGAKWMLLTHPTLTDGTDFNTIARKEKSGFHPVGNTTSAKTMVNIPSDPGKDPEPGVLQVNWMAGSLATGIHQVEHRYITSTGKVYHRVVTSVTNGTWSTWDIQNTKRGLLADNSDVNAMKGYQYVGHWYIANTTSANTMTGLPAGTGPSNLYIYSGPQSYGYTTQVLMSSGASWFMKYRTMIDATNFSEWFTIIDMTKAYEPVDVGGKNSDLLHVMQQRKGGVIGLSGRAGFALRVDHGTVATEQYLLPLLRKYGLAATMAVYSKQREVKPAENGVAWDVVEKWHRNYGMTFGNHSDDHLDKPDAAGWQAGIIGSLAQHKAQMPSVPMENYIPHGSIGYDRYGGFLPSNTHEAIYGTLAGRMALSTHALISGYRGGYYRPLMGRPMQGLAHWSMEESDPATFKTVIDNTIADKVGVCPMFHPEFIGLTGKMTWTQVEECLAYVAAKRDAGLLVPLTMDGLAFASVDSTYRDDLIRFPKMDDAAFWYSSGFTETLGAFTSSTAGAWVRALVSLYAKDWATGGAREAEWRVNSTAGANITLKVYSTTDGTRNAERTNITVPAGDSTHVIPFGIPLNDTSTFRTELILNSGQITIAESHVYAI